MRSSGGSVALAFHERDQLVLIGRTGRELAREPCHLSDRRLREAFGERGIAWSEQDAYASAYRRWVPDLPDVSAAANALLVARQKALTRRDEDDLILGLEAGADDYLMKPYNPRELMARIRTMLRRNDWSPDAPLRVGEVVVDVAGHHVTVGGRRVDCTPGEFEILAAMAAAPDRVFTRAQLLEKTRGFEVSATDRTVTKRFSVPTFKDIFQSL